MEAAQPGPGRAWGPRGAAASSLRHRLVPGVPGGSRAVGPHGRAAAGVPVPEGGTVTFRSANVLVVT